MNRIARLGRHLVLDVSPLRRSRDLRCLVAGQLLSTLGQLTTVAVPYQVYMLTRSSLDVGLVSLATVLPLIAGGLLGGSLADAADRRKMLLGAQLLTLVCSAGLAVNADTGPALWPLFALPAMAAGFAAAAESGLSAILPNLVRRSEVAAVNAMFQALFQIGGVAGPAVAGLLLAGAGVRLVYWMDVAAMAAAMAATFLMGPQVPQASAGHRPGLRSIADGFSYLRGRPVIQGTYLIDINAMVFGMPRAVFPALALTVFGGGARTLGFLYAAPGAGACSARSPPAGSPGSGGRAARSSPPSSCGARRSPASAWCAGCPPHSRCWPWPAAPTSSRRCSAARSSSSACLTSSAAG